MQLQKSQVSITYGGTKMSINKQHPLYQEYIAKCKTARKKYRAEEDSVLAQYPEWRGRDHPAGAELRAIELRHNAEIRSLQKEYSFLFEHFD